MDAKKLYALGKKLYDNDKYENILEDLYIEVDDLLDALDDKRMEIKLLIEEKEEKENEDPESKIKKLYQELSELAAQIDAYDTSEIEKKEKEMEIFKAKNKYKFMQLETAEKKYAEALKKKSSNLDIMLENLKKLRLNTLSLQKKLDRYKEEIKKAKKDLNKLEARRELVLKQISETQKEVHKKNKGNNEELEKIKSILAQKKNELDNIKIQIKKTFVKIGMKAQKEGLK